ncbi:MAG: non-heme iron oxygenase ferredoxin subunit [Actinobacteria bacterium]|jgi:3-phenylpropionate/trans-cinnamate dioxygenase ferredoxin subunit|nr:MAG: non-heme iron oxygenase ferredoxin subunit [Actinomycetota bacterium]
MTSAVRVCSVEDVPAGEARRFAVDGRLVAVVNLGDEGFRAVDAICSHEHYYLDEGEVDVDLETIECPKHGSTFDLDTGAARTLPAITPVDVFPVTVTDDDVLIEV